MGAARDFAEITIVNEPLALTEPLGADEPLRTLVERSVYADDTPPFTDYVETPHTETPRNDTQQVGEKLAAARRAKGLTLLDVAKGVKIKIEHLVAIEACDRDALPAVPFTAGFIKAYAQFLGLNADEYAAAYRKETGAPTALTEGPAPALQWETPQTAKREFSLPMGRDALVSYFGIGAAAFCVAWFGASMLPRTAPAPRVAAEAVKTEASVTEAPVTEAAVEVAAVAATAKPVFEIARAQTETTEAVAAVETAPETITAEVGTPTETAQVATGPVAPKLAPTKAVAVVEAVTTETVTMPPVEAVAAQVETNIAPITLPKGPKLAWAESEMKKEAAAKKAQAKREKAEAAAAKAEAEEAARVLAEAEAAEAAVTDLRADVAAMNVSAPVETAPVEAAPAPVAPVAPQQNIVAARILRAATPVYPERCARNAAAEESVDVIFSITVEGRPVGAAVVDTTNACFNSAAVDSASDMRFAPRMIDGKASIETAKVVTIRFTR